MFDCISFSRNIVGGRACIRGMCITVSHVVNMVANGMMNEDILREYPDLDAEDWEALQYAAFLSREDVLLGIETHA